MSPLIDRQGLALMRVVVQCGFAGRGVIEVARRMNLREGQAGREEDDSFEGLTSTAPVMSDENSSIKALAASTMWRAEDTPVRSETTTKTLRGTRKRDES